MPSTLTLSVPRWPGLTLRFKAPAPEVASREATASLVEKTSATPSGRSGLLDMRIAVLVDALDAVLLDVDGHAVPVASSFTEAAMALDMKPGEEGEAVLGLLAPRDVAHHVAAIDEWVKGGRSE